MENDSSSQTCLSVAAHAEKPAAGPDDRGWGDGWQERGNRGGIWGQQTLLQWAGPCRLADSLIMASPHCNGWNMPAEPRGGVDRLSTEIAPRAGRMYNGWGAPEEKSENRERKRKIEILTSPQHSTDCQSEAGRSSAPPPPHTPLDAELHENMTAQARHHYSRYSRRSDSILQFEKNKTNKQKKRAVQQILILGCHSENCKSGENKLQGNTKWVTLQLITVQQSSKNCMDLQRHRKSVKFLIKSSNPAVLQNKDE